MAKRFVRKERGAYANASVGKGWPGGIGDRTGLHGHVRGVRARRRARKYRHDSAALDSGINLFDTGDFYGMGDNELLLQKALAGQPRDRFLISVKFGGMRAPNGAFVGIDARPVAVKNFLAYT